MDIQKKEEDEVERLLRESPRIRAPRHDIQRNTVKEFDSDLGNSDLDTSMNYKDIGGSLTAALSKLTSIEKKYADLLSDDGSNLLSLVGDFWELQVLNNGISNESIACRVAARCKRSETYSLEEFHEYLIRAGVTYFDEVFTALKMIEEYKNDGFDEDEIKKILYLLPPGDEVTILVDKILLALKDSKYEMFRSLEPEKVTDLISMVEEYISWLTGDELYSVIHESFSLYLENENLLTFEDLQNILTSLNDLLENTWFDAFNTRFNL